LVLDNPHVDWLGARHGHLSVLAAAQVYAALGVPGNIGYHGDVAEPRHCAWREEWTAPARGAPRRHLLGLDADDLPIIAAPALAAGVEARGDWTRPVLDWGAGRGRGQGQPRPPRPARRADRLSSPLPSPQRSGCMRRRIVAGNWKLHGSRDFASSLLDQVAAGLPVAGVEVVVLPPLPYLGDLARDFGGKAIAFGAQDVSPNEEGAFTGEVSARMLLEVGGRYGLAGHSERRSHHGESSE